MVVGMQIMRYFKRRNKCNTFPLDNVFINHYCIVSLFMKAHLNASEVAKLLNVDRATVSRWLQKGLIPGAVRIQGRQQWRIPLSAYKELVKRQEHYESH